MEWRHDEIFTSLYLIEIKQISCGFDRDRSRNSDADRINAPVLDLGQVRSGIGS